MSSPSGTARETAASKVPALLGPRGAHRERLRQTGTRCLSFPNPKDGGMGQLLRRVQILLLDDLEAFLPESIEFVRSQHLQYPSPELVTLIISDGGLHPQSRSVRYTCWASLVVQVVVV